MGIDPMTALAIGGTLFSAKQQISTAKAQAKAVAKEGAIAADNKAIEVLRATGKTRASFLNSGFDLFGTPESALSSMYDVGQTDIGRIISNANQKSKSLVKAGVGQAIGTIAKTAGSFAMPSFGDMFGSAAGSGINTNIGGFATTQASNPLAAPQPFKSSYF